MIGENTISINHATMVRALRDYFAAEFSEAQRPDVLEVSEEQLGYSGGPKRFLVKIKNPEPQDQQ